MGLICYCQVFLVFEPTGEEANLSSVGEGEVKGEECQFRMFTVWTYIMYML